MKAIGIKMVDLQPMVAIEARKKGYKIGNCTSEDMGYEVSYPDGYKSWCPKDVADKAYFQLQDDNGDKISPKDIENFVAYSQLAKVGTKTTNVTLTTITGFEVHGQSSCVKAEDFSLDIGYKFARPHAEDQLWFALGFVLQWAKYGLHPKSEYAIDPDKQ